MINFGVNDARQCPVYKTRHVLLYVPEAKYTARKTTTGLGRAD